MRTKLLLAALFMAMVAHQALAQGVTIGGAGGGDWLGPIVNSFVGVIAFGIIEAAIAFYAIRAIAGHHYGEAMLSGAVGAVVLIKYATVAGWFTNGIGGMIAGLGG